MSNEPNEDLIEATIRRVAEAKAAREAAANADAGREPPARVPSGPDEAAGPRRAAPVDEDVIEATIRRVAATKAAAEVQAEEPSAAPAPVDEDVIEATIRRVAATKAAAEVQAEEPPAAPAPVDDDLIEATIRRVAATKAAAEAQAEEPPATAAPVDEDLIEATIRRVAATKAATEAQAEEPPAAAAPVDEEVIEATIRRVAATKAAAEAQAEEPPPPPARAAEAPPAPAPAAARQRPQASVPRTVPRSQPSDHADSGLAEAIQRLREDLDSTRRALQLLTARVDALQRTDGRASSATRPQPQPRAAAADDDWDDTPQLPRIPLGQPPRPPLFRDPSPQTATAQHLVDQEQEPELELELEPEEAAIDTRPLPEPLPPLNAERRGLDLLPRTYRITVEDKRRGVDLVPLHRALLGMDGVSDMSLLSYSNGVAIVSIEMVDELDPDALEHAIGRAMSRRAKAEVHNEHTLVVKLAEE